MTRDANGELRKIHIPLHYLYVFLAGAVLGMLTITGIAGSYTRMAIKVARFNQLRSEKDQLRNRFGKLEQEAREKDLQVASLGSLASEVSTLYGLKSQPLAEGLPEQFHRPAACRVARPTRRPEALRADRRGLCRHQHGPA